MSRPPVVARAPGRICLFGEHQDYLGLPVIAMAVDRYFTIEYRPLDGERRFTIHTPDLPDREPTQLDLEASEPRNAEDYCWGIGQVLLEEGFEFPRGGNVIFRSNIPFRAGCSSSSAMSAAWMRLLLEIGRHPERERYIQEPERAAYLVYRGEKEKFHGAGGMMDQYTCYLGGLVHVFPREASGGELPYGVERLAATSLQDVVLIDSGQPKDTQGVLSSVGDRARAAVRAAEAAIPGFDLTQMSLADFDAVAERINDAAARSIVRDHIINRDLCREGLELFRSGHLTPERQERLGALLTEEHRVLAQTLGISTPLIDELQLRCNALGAAGGKINGSGGGGTLFCYAPGAAEAVADGVEEAYGSRGVRCHRVREAPGAEIISN